MLITEQYRVCDFCGTRRLVAFAKDNPGGWSHVSGYDACEQCLAVARQPRAEADQCPVCGEGIADVYASRIEKKAIVMPCRCVITDKAGLQAVLAAKLARLLKHRPLATLTLTEESAHPRA